MTRTVTVCALTLSLFTHGVLHGQAAQSAPSQETQTAVAAAPPLAFDVVSIKPAPPGALPIVPAFMRDKGSPIIGLQTMAAPAWMFIGYAYRMQMSEANASAEKLPAWAKERVYTVTFRAQGEPTRDQVREMMRTMLAERFGLQTHESTRLGAVNRIVFVKPGVLGPGIKPHADAGACSTQDGASVGKAPDASKPPVAHCGFSYYHLPSGVMHIGITDTTLVDAARTLAGTAGGELALRPTVDGTGLTGKYDLTLEFRPDSGLSASSDTDDDGAPTLMQALRQQLGLKVEVGYGPIRVVMIDHINPPTAD